MSVTIPLDFLFHLFGRPASQGSADEPRTPIAGNTPETAPGDLKALLADGPQFPQSWSTDQFEVKALVKGGWPLVIDFVPAPGSCTYVLVSIGEQVASPVVIDSDGRQGRHLVRLDFPPGPPERPWPARYRVVSVTPSCPSRSHAASGSSDRPSPLEVYGIGAGPRAVGSISVTELHVRPSQPNGRTHQIDYSFATKSLFNRATVTFLKFDRSSGDGHIHATPIRSLSVPDLMQGPHQGHWNGLDDNKQLSLGIHRLQVRAWDNREDDASWAGAISSDFVTITRP
ncbi:hypothetical protein [Burkholderia oklahomensis]|uniref:hypothetical protein n=1 Tax=Burkholderia oklahomensis TaxID=342113 RepID=UPI000F5327DD|nr:hypothetical protein [Burkholderia oklahomensis]MBI0359533.1 hypothetical protein [Burkholderia oklahomensis]